MTEPRSGKQRLLRDLNFNIVLNYIVKYGPISRTTLARQSGLPIATVSRITGTFLSSGLIIEKPAEETTTGRTPLLLHINPTVGYVIGIKLSNENVLLTLCNLHCTIIHSYQAPLEQHVELEYVIKTMVTAIQMLLDQNAIPREKVLGVGIGLAGLIDAHKGLCHISPMFGWQDILLGPMLEDILQLPVRIDNDVNSVAVAERQFGLGQNITDFLLITIGSGIGIGIVVNGEIYRGSHGYAGEFGHTIVDHSPQALCCQCGHRGCIEAIISDYGLIQASLDTPVSARQGALAIDAFIARARAHDPKAQEIIQNAGMILGNALGNLINIFQPERIFITGQSIHHGLMLEPMQDAIKRTRFDQSNPQEILTLIETLDEREWARGAASLLLYELFQPPLYQQPSKIDVEDLLLKAVHS